MNTNNPLEFHVILSQLSELALSDNAKNRLLTLKPTLSERECMVRMRETTEAKSILELTGTPPLTSMNELGKAVSDMQLGMMLIPEQLIAIAQFLNSCKRMKSYLKRAEALNVSVAFYGESLYELTELSEEIDRSIRNNAVDDHASTELRNIRKKLENAHSAIKTKLDSILRSKKEWFSEGYVTTRAGRFVLPVKKEYKNQVTGTVVETSNTGGTYFIEPSTIRKMQDEIGMLQIEEENEVRKILYTLTALVDEHIREIELNRECMETLDFAFAKAKLSFMMEAIPVPLTTKREIVIQQGRHPLLNRQTCVPLDFKIGGNVNGVVITGPNTGGKTVALKTIGLLSIMAQSGLHVPVAAGSEFCMHNLILCDIGDGQSITENLSTFSSHITNIIDILRSTTGESLVLLDELGSGTDPAEGMGIAVSVLEELKRKGCLFVATTHYPEIKEYAAKTERLVNARMAFDRESLCPLYRLEIGEAGESCALYIAKRLGFPAHLLQLAHDAAYHQAFSQIKPEEAPPTTVDLTPKIQKEKPRPSEAQKRCDKFNIGDSVMVYPQKELGIVYQTANERGEIGIQIKTNKLLISHKRVKLQVPANELYPPDYDFSILFDTVANRKARHTMTRKHDPNAIIITEKEK